MGEAIFHFGVTVYITRLKGNASTLTPSQKPICFKLNQTFVR